MAEWIAFGDAALQFLLLNWAVQATVVLTAGLLLAGLPRLKPAARHGVLAASLVLALAAPAFTLGRWALAPRTPDRPAVLRRAVHAQARPGSAAHPIAASQRLTPNAQRPIPSPGYLLGLALLGIAVIRLVWLGCGVWAVQRMLRRARPVDPKRLYAACGYGLADIPVLEADCVSVPSVVGVRRPRIVIPAGFPESLEPKTLRDVLLHEEAHARRRDPLFLFLTAFCHAWLFWHPLAAVARRRMEAAAEDACDAYVLSRGVDATGYARTLLQVLEQAMPARRSAVTCLLGWAPAGTGAAVELKRRVTLILAGGVRTSPAVAIIAAVGMAGTASGLGLAHVGRTPRLPAFPAPIPREIANRSLSHPPGGLPSASPQQFRNNPIPGVKRAAAAPRPRPEVRTAPAAIPAAITHDVRLERSVAAAPILTPARLSPPREGRCVVYLLDVSGSMRPYQPEARRQLLELARSLSPSDTFNVLAFAAEVTPFALKPLAAGEDTLSGVEVWMDDLPQKSGTNLTAALREALATPGVTRVVIISDGEAWGTAQGRSTLVSLIERENRCGAAVQELLLGPAEEPTVHLLPNAPDPEPDRRTLEADQLPPLLP